MKKSPGEISAAEQAKIQKALDKYGLDLEHYSVAETKTKNAVNIRRIASDLFGNGVIKTGMALSFAKVEEQAKVSYLSALVEQNWILIRQNEIIIKQLQAQSKK